MHFIEFAAKNFAQRITVWTLFPTASLISVAQSIFLVDDDNMAGRDSNGGGFGAVMSSKWRDQNWIITEQLRPLIVHVYFGFEGKETINAGRSERALCQTYIVPFGKTIAESEIKIYSITYCAPATNLKAAVTPTSFTSFARHQKDALAFDVQSIFTRSPAFKMSFRKIIKKNPSVHPSADSHWAYFLIFWQSLITTFISLHKRSEGENISRPVAITVHSVIYSLSNNLHIQILLQNQNI